MPIEIRELVIKATVVSDNSAEEPGQSGSSTNNSIAPSEELINMCVEKVLEILKDKHER
ncbi:MAG: hypothetical protein JNK79_06670 [Chitinophagaceae bacterium]|nr:hypothetical protein [Chitinophagaceae bacterium]